MMSLTRPIFRPISNPLFLPIFKSDEEIEQDRLNSLKEEGIDLVYILKMPINKFISAVKEISGNTRLMDKLENLAVERKANRNRIEIIVSMKSNLT